MKILTAASFSTIVQFVLREGDGATSDSLHNHNPHVTVAGLDVSLPAAGSLTFDEILIRDEREGGSRRVQCVDGELRYDRGDRDALEYYFAVLISHISQRE